MSILGGIYPEPDKVIKKSSLHRRYDSGELDVFEAAHYFSGINNESSNSSCMSTRKSIMREDIDHDRRQQLGGGRISVDMAPMTMRHALLASHHYHQMCDSNKQRNIIKEKTKQKQPSSPGGKLASFLNSLFTRQTLLRDTNEKKKKKSSSSSSAAAAAVAQTIKDEEESPGGTGRWRRRRSSISHFRSTSTGNSTSASSAAGIIEYSKSMFSSSSSSVGGFRTPPPYVNNTSYKDNCRTNNYSDHKQLVPSTNLSKYGISKTSSSSTATNFDWLDEKLIKFTSNGLSSTKSKQQNNSNLDSCTKARSICSSSRVMDRYRGTTAADDQAAEKKEIIKRLNQVDDEGEDSDSSSDLFELQLNDFDNLGSGYSSSGLPVYETTHMDSIKRSFATPITSGPVKN